MKKLLLLPMFLLLLLALDSGCKKDPTGPDIPQTVDTLIHQAVFVLNEGNFGDTSGARLTEYDFEKSTVQLDAY